MAAPSILESIKSNVTSRPESTSVTVKFTGGQVAAIRSLSLETGQSQASIVRGIVDAVLREGGYDVGDTADTSDA